MRRHNARVKPTLACIHIYPVKSCAALTAASAEVQARGLQGDRRWMVIDGAGRFITARKHPRMVLIRARMAEAGLELDAPGMPGQILAAAPGLPRVQAMVWRDEVSTLAAEPAADHWISSYLGIPARFVHMDADATRAVEPGYANAGDEVSFADGFPLLLIGQASLDGLNARLDCAVPMLRFRPNLVIAGTPGHAEDAWQSIRIGEVRFDVVKPCSRCVLTTVDPQTGAFDPSGEPLRTLLRYRRGDAGVMFGQNLIARSGGTVRVGDGVEVMR